MLTHPANEGSVRLCFTGEGVEVQSVLREVSSHLANEGTERFSALPGEINEDLNLAHIRACASNCCLVQGPPEARGSPPNVFPMAEMPSFLPSTSTASIAHVPSRWTPPLSQDPLISPYSYR